MTVYAVVQLKINNREAYDRYQLGFWDVFKNHQGKLLISSEQPEVLEGEWSKDKIVLMSFPDKPSFKAWATSPEYLEIARDRHAGSTATILLVEEYKLEDGISVAPVSKT